MNYEELILKNLADKFGGNVKGFIRETDEINISGLVLKAYPRQVEEVVKKMLPDKQIIYRTNKINERLKNYLEEKLGFDVKILKEVGNLYLITATRKEPVGLGKPDVENKYTLVITPWVVDVENIAPNAIKYTTLHEDPRD